MTAARCVVCDTPVDHRLQCPSCARRTAEATRRRSAQGGAVTEAQVQRAVVAALLAAGWQVWRVGQRDARGTQDPGVSDLICARERVVFVEVKRPGGEQSPPQREFQAAVERAGGAYRIARSVEDVADMLRPAAAGVGAA